MAAAQSDKPMRQRVEEYISKLQDDIVSAFEKLDPNAPAFKRDEWLRAQGIELTWAEEVELTPVA